MKVKKSIYNKISFLLCLCVMMVSIPTGCGDGSAEETKGEYKIYCLNESGTALETVGYNTSEEEWIDKAWELFSQLQVSHGDYKAAVPENISINYYGMSGGVMYLYFDNTYSEMDAVTEIFARAAIVLTLTQLEEVSQIQFYVNNNPLKSAAGTNVGAMSASSFVDNVGKTLNNYESTTVTLYFANRNGNKLKSEIRTGMYDGSEPLEKYVVEQLIKGPSESGDYKIMPQGVKIRSINTNNGVCYVDFSAEFASATSPVKDETMIYAIVNSLTELSHINKVQISVKGETNVTLHGRTTLNQLFVRDLSYMED